MIKRIGKLKINYSFYKGEDYYSDGDVENDILEHVKKYSNFEELLISEDRWPILYHFSPNRLNLLEWYDFNPEARLLEIGAGCGALTGLFCEKTKQVDAIELSKRRSEIIAYRHRACSNLTVYAANIMDVQINGQYDYITLIGVLEYAKKYYQSDKSDIELLTKARELLTDQGQIIVAIENKFGLKYWSGAAEDHTGLYFEGLENYHRSSGVCTYSKLELTELLFNAGFENMEFYYPYPDYKLPKVIYSDQYLPSIGQIRGITSNFNQDRYVLFNETIVLDNIIENKLFDIFSNSYLVIAQKG